MHKFIDNIVAFSLKNKFFIFFCTTIAVIAGVVSFKHTPIDAFPDVPPSWAAIRPFSSATPRSYAREEAR